MAAEKFEIVCPACVSYSVFVGMPGKLFRRQAWVTQTHFTPQSILCIKWDYKMKVHNWLNTRSAKFAVASGVAAIVFAVFGTSASAQTWNNAGGDQLWFNGSNWVGGAAPTGATDDAIVGAPSPVTLDGNVDLNSLTVAADGVVDTNFSINLDFGGTAATTLNNAGTINMSNNSDLQFQNNVFNSGNININATTANTDIEIDTLGATLDGGGTITLSGSNAGINGLDDSTLTVVDQTIQGEGNIGHNSIGLVNQANGLIDANVSGQILELDANASGLVNSGTLQASNSGVLRILGSAVDNSGGQVIAQDGSEVRLHSSSFVGGTLESAGSGQLTIDVSTNVGLEDLTVNGSLVAENNSDTEITGTITNTGSILVAATTANTDIEVQAGGATLTGGGSVTLSGTNAGINGTGTLTVGDHTIEGQGSIGHNVIGLVNSSAGLIDANVASQTLNIDTNVDGVVNDGVMQASNEGRLRFSGSTVYNVGGLIEAKEDSVVAFSYSTITGGVLNSVGTGEMEVEVSSDVRFESLTNNGTIVSLNNSDTELLGTIVNTGMMESRATTADTDYEIKTGDVTLTGGGVVKLSGNNAGINGDTGSVLTIGDQTIEGEGSIGHNVIGLVNSASGLVDANVSGGVLNIDSDQVNDFLNEGTLRASDGGILRISGTDMANSNVIESLDGSRVEINNSSITGGTLRSVGTGTVDILTSTNSLLENVTIEGNMRSFNNSDTEILGTITNTGTMEVLATTAPTSIEVQTGDATLTGGGTVTLSGSNARMDGLSGTVLTIGDQTVEGQGSIGVNTMGVINSAAGLVDANVSGQTLNIDADSTNAFTNNGMLQASNGGTLRFTSTELTNNSIVEAGDGSKVELTGSDVVGGTLRSIGSGTIDVLTSSNVRLENLTTEGRFRSFNNSDTEVAGTINNTGTMEVLATTAATDIEVQTGGATFTGGGTVRLSGTNARINGATGATLDIASQIVIGEGNVGSNVLDIVNAMGGTIEADAGVLTIDPVGTSVNVFSNDGTLRASGGGKLDSVHSLVNNGTIDTDAGSEVEALSLVSNAGSLLTGNGFIDVENGSIVVNGVVAPGSSAGNLTLMDDTIFGSTAVLETELESNSLFDLLSVQGELLLDGALAVDLLVGFNPLMTDTFAIATATDGIMGEFANVADGGMLLTTGGEGSFMVSYTSSSVVLSNFSPSAVPEPSAALCLVGLGLGVVVRRRRKA
ncbi:beta strand repeat-containing protein [Mariniblastus fucicola]|uniref:Ice-binding protein C-terminal domain-containing protein n=1 Tax=Mariniblastus fucicola TaxID=980251 RepID=A0A5B9P616_9BACT|nr:PEP-CTERM sorting domain-containing protein [Mariniblastus fucicola]QEG21704.1 hypothetical protein MFFC18_15630 [Mariniblastus fucicola]